MISIEKTARKTNVVAKEDLTIGPVDNDAEYVVLEPAGYPMSSILDEFPEIENPEVFEHYAREQWKGTLVFEEHYLFDKRMYPDFAYKVKEVKPSGSAIGPATTIIVRDAPDEPVTKTELKSSVTFDEVIGQHNARQKCRIIERFLEEPEKFGKWAPRNILFFGPSGTGKTMFAKAIANKAHVPIIPVKATELIGEFVGEGARQIHQLYDRAQESAPCIVFIDELDAVALDRRNQELRGDVAEIVNALLTEMDGLVERPGVCTIGATNRITSLDPAVRSRFEEEIEFMLPTEQERHDILKSNISTFPIAVADIDLRELARMTGGLSGRDIVEKILKTALHRAIADDRQTVNQEDMDISLKKVRTSGNTLDPEKMYI